MAFTRLFCPDFDAKSASEATIHENGLTVHIPVMY